MNAFKKVVSPLEKVFCEIEYTEDGRLSITGKTPNSAGQCADAIQEMITTEEAYNPGWNTRILTQFLLVWDTWHLNDMQPGCEHQRAEKWKDKRIDPAELPNTTANRDERGIMAIWVRETEHPDGLLCKPCPVCGFKYGSAWLKMKVPEDVLSFLASLPDSGIKPGKVYDTQAENFLAKTGATFEVKYIETGKYFDDDKESRDIYEITLTSGKRKYVFRFGQSINKSGKWHAKGRYGIGLNNGNTVLPPDFKPTFGGDLRQGLDYEENNNFSAPSLYDVLSVLQKYHPGSFDDFCSEFGYDTDPKRAEKTYKAVLSEYENLSRLFSDEELEEMAEIQ